MLTYQVRRRVFRLERDAPLTFPARCVIRLHFGPDQPFGCSAGGGRTAIRAKPAHVLFDANTGAHTIESLEPLRPLEVTIEEPNRTARLRGTVLEVTQQTDTLAALEDLVQSLYFALPVFLNVEFADPPLVRRVDGRIGEVPFRWELAEWTLHSTTTTQEQQEERFVQTWNRLPLVAGLENRRLFAALHYFHVAVRLARAGTTPGEFMAEMLLNLSKVLEVLFGQKRDAVRAGLKALGYDGTTMERFFLPAMALRNEIDVGHVELALFTRTALTAIHAYTEAAESAFRELLERVLLRVEAGTWSVRPYEHTGPSAKAKAVVARLKKAFVANDGGKSN